MLVSVQRSTPLLGAPGHFWSFVILGLILNDWTPGVNGYGYDAKYYDRYAKYYNSKPKPPVTQED